MVLNFGGQGSFGRTKLNRDSSLGVTGRTGEQRGGEGRLGFAGGVQCQSDTRGQITTRVMVVKFLLGSMTMMTNLVISQQNRLVIIDTPGPGTHFSGSKECGGQLKVVRGKGKSCRRDEREERERTDDSGAETFWACPGSKSTTPRCHWRAGFAITVIYVCLDPKNYEMDFASKSQYGT